MKQFIVGLLIIVAGDAIGQSLPIIQMDGKSDKPFVFMVSGDGGSKGFTLSLANAIHGKGYSLALMDAKTYFWSKKTPEETTSAIAAYVAKQLAADRNRKWIIAGYSFGADIAPFVVNRLPDTLKQRLQNVILLSPSTSTDFEIHLSDMLGIGKKRSMDVIQEINKLTAENVVLLRGKDEDTFPVGNIKLTRFRFDALKGDHHFGGDYNAVADHITASIPSQL